MAQWSEDRLWYSPQTENHPCFSPSENLLLTYYKPIRRFSAGYLTILPGFSGVFMGRPEEAPEARMIPT
jgi:hypothetical protein